MCRLIVKLLKYVFLFDFLLLGLVVGVGMLGGVMNVLVGGGSFVMMLLLIVFGLFLLIVNVISNVVV